MEVMLLRARRAMEMALDKSREQRMRLKDLAEQASKKAWLVTSLALPSSQSMPDDELLQRHGVTPELQDFVRGFTIDTFRDFPTRKAEDNEKLSPWKEQHALLVLSAVPELSRLRYELCPKLMKDKTFWRIYFTLVNGRIARYVHQQNMHHGETTEPEQNQTKEVQKSIELQNIRSGDDEADEPEIVPVEEPRPSASLQKPRMTDEELDIYLTSGLDNSDEESIGEDDVGVLDAELEELVKDAGLDNDGKKTPTQ